MRVLGLLDVGPEGGDSVDIGGPKQRAALAALCLTPGKPVSVDSLIQAVWGDPIPKRAKQILAVYMSNLRGLTGIDIEWGTDAYALRIAESEVDWCVFAGAIESVDDMPVEEAGEVLRDALLLWRGEPFQGLDGHGVFRDTVSMLEMLHLRAEMGIVEADLRSSDPAVALPLTTSLVRRYEFDEQVQMLHMRALYLSGRQSDALKSSHNFKARLSNEFGLEPAKDFTELESQILLHDPTVSGRPKPPTNLPLPITSFIGRESEINELIDVSSRDRLVTITGLGGVGKTRLAIEVARRRLADFPNGVFLIDLADVAESGGVGQRFMSQLGIAETPHQGPIEQLIEHLATLRCMLVVDNCEHIVDEVAEILTTTAPSCPGLHVLATSRTGMGVQGETQWHLPGLRVEPGGEAEQLYADRARRATRTFTIDEPNRNAVNSICRALDGIPLAIELAAARSQTMTPQEIDARMSDRLSFLIDERRAKSDRHRALESVIDWSYDLLNEHEQRIFRMASIFRGGFDAAALAGVCSDDGGDVDTALERLVDVSLVTADPSVSPTRCRLLETIHEYAARRLEEHEETANARDRHLHTFISFAVEAHLRIGGRTVPAAAPFEEVAERRGAVGREVANLRWAMDHALRLNESNATLAIAAPLSEYLLAEDRVVEAREVLESSLRLNHCLPSPLLCAVLANYYVALAEHEDGDFAAKVLERAGDVCDRAGSTLGQATILMWRASEKAAAGNLIDAVELYDTAIEVAHSSGLTRLGSQVWNRSISALMIGDVDGTIEALGKLDNEWPSDRVVSLIIRACVANYRLAYEEAVALVDHALTLDPTGRMASYARYTKVIALAMMNRLNEAECLCRSLELHYRDGGRDDTAGLCSETLGVIAMRSGDHDEARVRFSGCLADSNRRPLSFRWRLLHMTAGWLAATGDPETAAVVLGHCDVLTEQHKYDPRALSGMPGLDLSELSHRLEPAHLEALIAKGASISTDELIEQVAGRLQ